ncbi:MAG: endolytic transglycosylase MltG [Eubacterium sp.]|nr:endolytic transglycosylase MltG [Eubacterium sp.]
MSETKRKHKSRGYKAALFGIKGILRILIYAFMVIILIYIGTKAYSLGHEAFDEKPVDIGEGRNVVVTVTEDMSVYDVGKMLRAEGLLTESPEAFWLQEFLSEYHNEILPGTYTLKTSMTVQEMLPILAQQDKVETAPVKKTAPGMGSKKDSSEGNTENTTDKASDKTSGGTSEEALEEALDETLAENIEGTAEGQW